MLRAVEESVPLTGLLDTAISIRHQALRGGTSIGASTPAASKELLSLAAGCPRGGAENWQPEMVRYHAAAGKNEPDAGDHAAPVNKGSITIPSRPARSVGPRLTIECAA